MADSDGAVRGLALDILLEDDELDLEFDEEIKARGGGYAPIWADRDVPPGRAGFWAKDSLKTGLIFPKLSVKAGFARFLR